jgi:hypothetical protein
VAEKKAKDRREVERRPAEEASLPVVRLREPVVQYTRIRSARFFWVCEKACGYTKRTR